MVLPLAAIPVAQAGLAVGGGLISGALRRDRRDPRYTGPNDTGYRNQLRQQAMGGGPSQVAMQARAAQDQAGRQAQSLAASARGPSIGAAQRQAANAAAAAQQGIAAAALPARVAEQQAAQQAYGGLLAQEQAARAQQEAARQAQSAQRASTRGLMADRVFGGLGAGLGGFAQMALQPPAAPPIAPMPAAPAPAMADYSVGEDWMAPETALTPQQLQRRRLLMGGL